MPQEESMRINYVVIASAIIFSTQTAVAALSCKYFLVLESEQQLVFVGGLVDGMGATLGVMDSFSRNLASRAGTPEERSGIENMHQLPKGFLSKGCCMGNEIITEKIVEGCREHSERPVGNMLTDVMSGAL